MNKNGNIFVLLCVTLISLLGCGNNEVQTPSHSATNIIRNIFTSHISSVHQKIDNTIWGTVSDETTGEPVPNCPVRLQQGEFESTDVLFTNTDSRGCFSFSCPLIKPYFLCAIKPDYHSCDQMNPGSPVHLTVKPGKTFSVYGTITTHDGMPISGAIVTVVPRNLSAYQPCYRRNYNRDC